MTSFDLTLTLARTCYFPILERTWRGGGQPNPHAISPLIEIELLEKD